MWFPLQVSSKDLCIEIVLNCGQSFRWVKTGDLEWTSVLRGKLVSLKQLDDDTVFKTGNPQDAQEMREILQDYFQLSVDLQDLYTRWAKDANFDQKAFNFRGIRMLRQDPIENIDSLCREFGELVGKIDGIDFYAFPKVEKLTGSQVEEKLRELGFGYRAKYIVQSAEFIMNQPEKEKWLFNLRNLSYPEAKEQLLQLSGVGPKVADCICLMSLDKHEAIPVDTHVWQIATRDYKLRLDGKSLTSKNYQAVGDMFRNVFGDYAGWAHSVLFAADLRQFKGYQIVETVKKIKTESAER